LTSITVPIGVMTPLPALTFSRRMSSMLARYSGSDCV
jgi:hypothetical protein